MEKHTFKHTLYQLEKLNDEIAFRRKEELKLQFTVFGLSQHGKRGDIDGFFDSLTPRKTKKSVQTSALNVDIPGIVVTRT